MESLESFVRDIRYVTRALVRTPAFFAVTVITLALGIGATTAIYSVINGVLLRPLPYPDADRVVQLWQVGEKGVGVMSPSRTTTTGKPEPVASRP